MCAKVVKMFTDIAKKSWALFNQGYNWLVIFEELKKEGVAEGSISEIKEFFKQEIMKTLWDQGYSLKEISEKVTKYESNR